VNDSNDKNPIMYTKLNVVLITFDIVKLFYCCYIYNIDNVSYLVCKHYNTVKVKRKNF